MIVACTYLFIIGCCVGSYLAERKHKQAIDCYNSMHRAAKSALSTQRFVGNGASVSNVAIWKMGERSVQVTIQPADNFATHGTKAV